MKYLSILSVLLLIGGNFCFAMEDGDYTLQPKEMRLEEKANYFKKNKERIEHLKKKYANRAKNGNGYLIIQKQEESRPDNTYTLIVDVDGEEQKIGPNGELKPKSNYKKINIIKDKTILKRKKPVYNGESCNNSSTDNDIKSKIRKMKKKYWKGMHLSEIPEAYNETELNRTHRLNPNMNLDFLEKHWNGRYDSDCVGESCDETNILSNNTNCNDGELSIPKGKTILNKKKVYI